MRDQLKRKLSNFRLMRSFILLGMILLIVLSWYGLRSVQAGAWASKMGMPTPRYGVAAAEINGKLYVVGGSLNSEVLNTLEVYDPGTNAWTTKRPMPTARALCAAAVIDGKLYVVGGSPLSTPYNILEVYDPATDTWASKQGMPTARDRLVAVAINGKLYAVGGSSGNVSKLNNLEVYDPATNTWTAKQAMPTARHGLAAGEINGKLYAVGGSANEITNVLEVYDPATNSWTAKQGMPTARYGLAAGVINGILYAVGGSSVSVIEPLNTLESYDPATNQWTSHLGMPTARLHLGVAGFGGILYAVGGEIGGTRYNTLEVYDVAAVPEIAVSEPGVGNINDGGSFSLGTTTIGNPVTKTFTITNSGTAPLNLSSLNVSGGFIVVSQYTTTTPVAGFGGTATFTLRMPASAAGTQSGTVSFNNDDADENPFNFTISGTVISAGGPYTITEGGSLTLTASPNNGSSTYSWDINGDGLFGDATGANPSLTWTQLNALGINDGPALFNNVKVRVSDGVNPAVDSAATSLNITNAPPVITNVSGLMVAFEGTPFNTTVTFSDPAGTSDTYTLTINWGDGNTSVIPNAVSGQTNSHAYADSDGIIHYTQSIYVTDSDGASSTTFTRTVDVNNIAPNFTGTGADVPATVAEGSPVTVTTHFTDPGGDNDTYTMTIKWGDGNTSVYNNVSFTQSFTHTYADGPATVQLDFQVNDEGSFANVSSHIVKTLTVQNVAPTLTLSGAATVGIGQIYTLNLSSNDPGQDIISNWTINWGDGSSPQVVSGNPSNVTHIYISAPNNFTISATAMDEDGTYAAGNTAAVTVTCTNNPVVTNGNDSGAGSLRQAIADACPGSTITFASGLNQIALTTGQLVIDKNLTLSGPGANLLTVLQTAPNSRVFLINTGTVNFTGMTITGGNLTSGDGSSANARYGGGILNLATLTLNRCTVSGNTAIYNQSGTSGGGGGIANLGGLLTVINSAILDNVANRAFGGGIYNTSPAPNATNVINSTISGNQVVNDQPTGSALGGGIYSSGILNVIDSTITANLVNGSGSSIGGGVCLLAGTANVKNSIIAANRLIGAGQSGPDVSEQVGTGGFTSQGYNLIGNNDGSSGFSNGINHDKVGSSANPLDPRLAALANNGGPTRTCALNINSPAAQAGGDATTLNDAINNSAVTIVLADATAFPANIELVIQIDNEQMLVTGKSANTLTVTRGANGTTPAAHISGAAVNPAFDQRGTGYTRVIGTIDIGAFEIQCPVINVVNPAVTTGTTGTTFNQTFTQSGGNGNITFSTSGTLPNGLMLSPAGALSGTPTQTGTFPITVKATDANGCMGTGATYNLVISCPSINVINPATSTGMAGASFNQTFTQTGGAGLTTFSTTSTLPDGLTLQPNGTLNGTPTQVGVFPITVKATDANGCIGTGATYNLVINCQSSNVTNPATTTGTLGLPFSQSFSQTGGIGTTTFSTTSTLPNGLTLQANGILSGTPTQNGVFPIIVKAVDSNGCMGTGATYNLNITCTINPVVTNANDNGEGSLRYTITTACPGSTITFDTARVFATPQTITLTSGEMVIGKNLTINGTGANRLTVSGNHASRIFNINSGATVTLDNLTIANGKVSNDMINRGGGIYNLNSTLIITNSTLSGNSISGSNAGAGAGIFNDGGTLTIINSTISGNAASGGGGLNRGGGIFNTTNASGSTFNVGNLTIINSTLSDNSTSGGAGGGIFNNGTLTITNSTLSGNATNGGAGGGIFSDSGIVNTRNTIIAGNNSSSNGSDVYGPFNSQGHNLIGKSDGSGGFTNGTNGDQVGSLAAPLDPRLGALANNGGPTQTHALNLDSPAIHAAGDVTTLNGAINNSVITIVLADATAFPANINFVIQIDNEQMLVTGKSANTLTVVRGFNNTAPAAHNNGAAVNPAFDQRGLGFPRINAGRPDIGAFELDAPPIAFCKDLNLFLNASGTVTVNATDTNNGSTDDDGISTIEISKDGSSFASSIPYSCSDLGVKTATLRVTDTNGQQATCTSMVTIGDNLAPTITCPPNRTVECPMAVNTGTATATDNCTPSASITITGIRSDNQPLSATYPLGTTTITWKAVDDSNNFSTCTQTITVSDHTAPVIQCAQVAAQSANTNASCQATVPDVRALVRAQSSDSCTAQASLTITQSPQPGSVVSAAGAHPITVTVMDASSNTTTCMVAFTVIDNTPPQIVCPANITTTTAANQCLATVTISPAMATDNCGIQSVVGTRSDNQPLSAAFPKGITTITWKATDTSGNQVTCQQTVTVRDAQAPTIQCPSPIVMVLPPTCPVVTTAVVSYVVNATDNCGGVTTLCSPPSGSAFPVGTTTVTCTATDAANNTASCSFPVTIFSGCLQDDTSAGSVVLYNLVTGDYRYCCNGQVLKAGRGVVTGSGCSRTITHNDTDRRVQIQVDLTTKRGTASLQTPVGTMMCTITDRDVSNNTACAVCAASPLS